MLEALITAVQYKKEETVRKLLNDETTLKQIKKNINHRILNNEYTLILLMFEYQMSPDILKKTLDLGADITQKTTKGYSVLTRILWKSDYKRLKVLLNHPDISKIVNLVDDNQKSTPLINAFIKYMHPEKYKFNIINPHKECIRLLLQMGANPLLLNSRGYNILTYLIRPREIALFLPYLSKHKDSLDQETQRYIRQRNEVTAVGHILGIADTIEIRLPNSSNTRKHEMEGEYNANSMALLVKCIDHYLETLSESPLKQISADTVLFKKIFKQIQTAYHQASAFCRGDGSVTTDELITRYKNDQLILFPVEINTVPTGLPGAHMFAIALYQNYLICSNRGFGDCGVVIGKIDPKIINARFIETLYGYEKVKLVEKEEMTEPNVIQELLRYFFPKITCQQTAKIPVFSQQIGTCTFVNPKSLIAGILCVLKMENVLQKTFPLKGRCLTQKYNITNEKEAWEYAKKWAYAHYKLFTKEMRNAKVNELLENLNQFSNNLEESLFHTKLLLSYLRVHYGQPEDGKSPEKIMAEKERALLILKIFSEKLVDKSDAYQKLFIDHRLTLLKAALCIENEFIFNQFIKIPGLYSSNTSKRSLLSEVLSDENPFILNNKSPLLNFISNSGIRIPREITSLYSLKNPSTKRKEIHNEEVDESSNKRSKKRLRIN